MSLTLERVPSTRPLTFTFTADLLRATVVIGCPAGERLALVTGAPIRSTYVILAVTGRITDEAW